jgi:hypothetical protein
MCQASDQTAQKQRENNIAIILKRYPAMLNEEFHFNSPFAIYQLYTNITGAAESII